MSHYVNPLLKKKGFVIKRFKDPNLLKDLRKCVKKYFHKSTDYYCNLPLEKFRKIALKCQNEINRLKIQKKFHKSEKKFISKILNGDEALYELQVFFRIVRPLKKTNIHEAISWHRETFYTKLKFPYYTINIWFPILNVNKNNTLQYIPGSHLIDDKKIKRIKIRMNKEDKKKNITKKFSAGHKLGFLYHPKKIISGVNLKNKKNLNIKENNYSLFSSLLIHGNSQNLSNKIRFAMGFGIIAKSHKNKIKKFNRKRLDIQTKTTDQFVSVDQL